MIIKCIFYNNMNVSSFYIIVTVALIHGSQ